MDEDEQRLAYAHDERVPDAGTFTINKEDHTIGNLLRMQILREPAVRFAGYQLPHPLMSVAGVVFLFSGRRTPRARA